MACSGLSVKAAKDEWKHLGFGKKNLGIALDWLHEEFSDAPVLGSLINPAKSNAANIVSWDELSEALNNALEQESEKSHQSEIEQKDLEATVVAQGMAKAAMMLAGKYQWVVTNVPYLARGKQAGTLKDYIEKHYPTGKSDLATAFLERCLEYCIEGGSTSVVLPQNWLFLPSYKKYREKLLANNTWIMVTRLGAKGFETPMWDFNVQLITLSRGNVESDQGLFTDNAHGHRLSGLDVSEARSASVKSDELVVCEVKSVGQAGQLANPDYVIAFDCLSTELMGDKASCVQGIKTGDDSWLRRNFWEFDRKSIDWTFYQSTFSNFLFYGGMEYVLNWTDDGGLLARRQGGAAWGKAGLAISQMSTLPTSIYCGHKYDSNMTTIVTSEEYLIPLIAYGMSEELSSEVRTVDQSLKPVNSSFEKISFDLERWKKVADERFPNGLPRAYTNDPTQWIFHGHPSGSVIWDEEARWTVKSDFRIDDSVLQVAVARLLGYQWPAELDLEVDLAFEQRAWVKETKKLHSFVDDDGIVCLPAVRGEKSADERLEGILQAAYGDAWSSQIRNQLLESVNCKNKTLELWLQEKFFEQHCKLFQHRPFIWHIWDGLKDGFSALLNYHQLDKKNLERLVYTYLDDWMRTQSHQQSEGVDGASERLIAAKNLKQRLENILEGESPCDIFVRWKPLEEQPIGWNPDLNDGVRLNIRPFMSVADVGKKGGGILRIKPNVHWKKDRGQDVESAPWYNLGLEYDGKEGDRINDHHLSLAEKQNAKV